MVVKSLTHLFQFGIETYCLIAASIALTITTMIGRTVLLTGLTIGRRTLTIPSTLLVLPILLILTGRILAIALSVLRIVLAPIGRLRLTITSLSTITRLLRGFGLSLLLHLIVQFQKFPAILLRAEIPVPTKQFRNDRIEPLRIGEIHIAVRFKITGKIAKLMLFISDVRFVPQCKMI